MTDSFTFNTCDMNLASLVLKKSDIDTLEKFSPVLDSFLTNNFDCESDEYPIFQNWLMDGIQLEESEDLIKCKEDFGGSFGIPIEDDEVILFAYYVYNHATYEFNNLNPSSKITFVTKEMDGNKLIVDLLQDAEDPYYECVDSSDSTDTTIGFTLPNGSMVSISTGNYEGIDLMDLSKTSNVVLKDVFELINS